MRLDSNAPEKIMYSRLASLTTCALGNNPVCLNFCNFDGKRLPRLIITNEQQQFTHKIIKVGAYRIYYGYGKYW